MLQKTTFKDKKVIEKLNKDYYVIFFNGETKVDIKHQNEKFSYMPKGIKSGYHEIVYFYLKNRQEIYPTILFLDNDFKELALLQIYLSASDLMKIL